MAKAFTNPKIVKALTLGYKYNEKPTIAARYFLQAVTQMQKENLISKDELNKIEEDIKEAGY
jgi:type I site-specific restriction-modification system R (restriction) subunit